MDIPKLILTLLEPEIVLAKNVNVNIGSTRRRGRRESRGTAARLPQHVRLAGRAVEATRQDEQGVGQAVEILASTGGHAFFTRQRH
jgi:hypothetical protein